MDKENAGNAKDGSADRSNQVKRASKRAPDTGQGFREDVRVS